MTDRKIYYSKIDWWVWAVVLFTAIIVCFAAATLPMSFSIIYCTGIIGVEAAAFLGCRYAIEGNTLIVYMFFRPNRYPIDKISEVKYTTGILSAPALSTKRLSIKFSDKKILKSSMPLEISPKDCEAFVERLLHINPSIKVIRKEPRS